MFFFVMGAYVDIFFLQSHTVTTWLEKLERIGNFVLLTFSNRRLG